MRSFNRSAAQSAFMILFFTSADYGFSWLGAQDPSHSKQCATLNWRSMKKLPKAKPFDIERLFRALADRTRLRLLNLMGRDEVCVCYFVEVLRTPQPKISRHLAYLRRAGVVGVRREGKWMHYRITEPSDPHAAKVFNDIRGWLLNDPAMQRDRDRLVQMCCVKVPAHLERAPKPLLANVEEAVNELERSRSSVVPS